MRPSLVALLAYLVSGGGGLYDGDPHLLEVTDFTDVSANRPGHVYAL